ncbi:MAG TPA: PDZ domain-containing protein [Chitinophagales bacterium]|nr:PDZ domain-containing protein [Chitinophagales bacterium]HNE46071.1 PDZ domain-containing protein [Chitinophagales bacterium]HNK96705.1 PDZ domain-containing protein [Chitinophagales bacterium]
MNRTFLLACLIMLIAPLSAQLSFTGAGVLLQNETVNNYPVIKQVLKFSPASDAGLQAGEVVWSVNGQSTEGKTIKDVVAMIKGNNGESRTLVVGSDRRTVDITIRLIKGNCTDGDCNNGEGRIEEPNGDIYVGNFTNGKFDGYGMYYYYTGEHMYARYDGHFVAGKREGDGVLDNYDGGYKFTGTFKGGQANGNATMTFYNNNNTYTGNFIADKPSGSGTLTFADGSTKTFSPTTVDEILLEAGVKQETQIADNTDNKSNNNNTDNNNNASDSYTSGYDFSEMLNKMANVEYNLQYAMEKYASFYSAYRTTFLDNNATAAEEASVDELKACVDYVEKAFNLLQAINNSSAIGESVTELQYEAMKQWSKAVNEAMELFVAGLAQDATVSTWYWMNISSDKMEDLLDEASAARHAF